jgi:hypothetical protein
VPVKLENVSPGKHTVRIYLKGFGVLKEPELTFQDWEETVDVQPGKNMVIKARPWSFSDLVYKARRLANDTIKMTLENGKGSAVKTIDASFTDRKGMKIPVSVAINGSCDPKSASVAIRVAYDGKEQNFSLTCNAKETKETKQTVEKIDCAFSLNYKYENYASIEYSIERNDISTDESSNP